MCRRFAGTGHVPVSDTGAAGEADPDGSPVGSADAAELALRDEVDPVVPTDDGDVVRGVPEPDGIAGPEAIERCMLAASVVERRERDADPVGERVRGRHRRVADRELDRVAAVEATVAIRRVGLRNGYHPGLDSMHRLGRDHERIVPAKRIHRKQR